MWEPRRLTMGPHGLLQGELYLYILSAFIRVWEIRIYPCYHMTSVPWSCLHWVWRILVRRADRLYPRHCSVLKLQPVQSVPRSRPAKEHNGFFNILSWFKKKKKGGVYEITCCQPVYPFLSIYFSVYPPPIYFLLGGLRKHFLCR
jgi:hypothetical protein